MQRAAHLALHAAAGHAAQRGSRRHGQAGGAGRIAHRGGQRVLAAGLQRGGHRQQLG
jgi:hypothetical protein